MSLRPLHSFNRLEEQFIEQPSHVYNIILAAIFTIAYLFSLLVGHPPSERGAHRGAGGGAEGERSDHSREGSGARPGGAGAHAVGETGTVFLTACYCVARVKKKNILTLPSQ